MFSRKPKQVKATDIKAEASTGSLQITIAGTKFAFDKQSLARLRNLATAEIKGNLVHGTNRDLIK